MIPILIKSEMLKKILENRWKVKLRGAASAADKVDWCLRWIEEDARIERPWYTMGSNTNIFTKSITYKYIHKVNQIQIYLQSQQNTNIIKKLITSHTNVFLKSSVNRGGCQNWEAMIQIRTMGSNANTNTFTK